MLIKQRKQNIYKDVCKKYWSTYHYKTNAVEYNKIIMDDINTSIWNGLLKINKRISEVNHTF